MTPARTLAAGEVITEPGLWAGVPMARYHSADLCDGPSISSSGLRTIFKQSPAHYWATSPLNPERIVEPESDAFILGRAAHHLLLSEDAFSTLFVVRPSQFDSWRTDAAKAWRAAQEAEGRTVLLPAQIEAIRGMARSLAKHPLVANGILNGAIEQSLIFKDEPTGAWVKSRPDAIPTASGDFSDLKTTTSIGFDIDRDVSKFRYDMQAATVKLAAKAVLNMDMASFSFVFVEKAPPHTVDVLTLDDRDIEAAELDLRAALDTFAHCLRTDDWFGPSGRQSDARFVHLSSWAKDSAVARREFLAREIAA